MRSCRIFLICLFSLASAIALKAAPIGICVNDEFNGSELNEEIWNSRGNVYVGESGGAEGSVKLDATSKILSQIESQMTVAPEPGQTVVVSGQGVVVTDWAEGVTWGLSSAGGQDLIVVQSPVAQNPERKDLIVVIRRDGGEEQHFRLGLANQFNGAWVIEWSDDRVVVKRDDNTLFDSKDGETESGESWRIPTAPMGVYASTYINNNTLSMDGVSMKVEPKKAD